jgi:hypothetical protein
MKHRSLKRALAVVSVAATAATLTAFGAIEPTAATGSEEAPWTVSATPNSALTDGQLVTITVTTTTTNRVYEANAQICRLGVDYASSDGDRPAKDFAAGDLNCPAIPISSSADVQTGDANLYTSATEPGGSSFSMYVGSGVAEWPASSTGQAQRLTCDSENPCALVVEVYGSVAPGVVRWIPYVQELTYRVDDPVAGCGGPAEGVLNAAGPERITDIWIGLTLDQCRRPDAQKGAASRTSFSDEADAMDGFSSGALDLAYSAVGYDPDAALGRGTRSEPLSIRDSVAVPVALNATVVAVGNGRRGPNDRKVPFTDVRLTMDQVAHMFSGGPGDFEQYERAAFRALNPQFDEASIFLPATIQVGAFAPADASSWFLSSFLDANRPALWKVPDTNTFGPERGLDRGSIMGFGVAKPSFNNAVDMFTGNSVLVRTLRTQNTDAYGGIWALTDLETATRLGLSVASIENANGEFISPTAESMSAAVATMKASSDGRLMPDPTATVERDAVQPYPLTFIDYAIAPTAKLVDATCTGRPMSQALLSTWLTYAVTDGQDHLPVGNLPLTDELRTAASAAIAEVGTVTPDCFKEPTDTPTGASPAPGGGAVGNRVGNRTAGAGTIGDPVGVAAADAPAADDPAPEVPEFTMRRTASTVAGVGGLVIVFGLLTMMALATTGRRPTLAALRTRFGGTR